MNQSHQQDIYLDHNGTFPVRQEVKDYLLKRLNGDNPFANPNAIHTKGTSLKQAIEQARSICAETLGAMPSETFFNSGASESISHLCLNYLLNAKAGQKILVSEIEHAAVWEAVHWWGNKLNLEIIEVSADTNGIVGLAKIEELIEQHKDIAMVAVMAANNETGALQPFEPIATLCSQNEIPYLCDTTQLIGKIPFDFNRSSLKTTFVSGHKLGALPGTGILLVKDFENLTPFVFGGGQESFKRGGTQNYLGIETLACALSCLSSDLEAYSKNLANKLEFEQNLKDKISEAIIFGDQIERLPNTTMLSIPGIHGQALQIELESHGLFVTTSSACSDNYPSTSRVIRSMGFNDSVGRGAVRVSFGPELDISQTLTTLTQKLVSSFQRLGQIGWE